MTTNITNVPDDTVVDAVQDNANFNTEQANIDKRFEELMCKLEDLNGNLKILVTYFAVILDQEITKDDANDDQL
jgi:hypothetical protein